MKFTNIKVTKYNVFNEEKLIEILNKMSGPFKMTNNENLERLCYEAVKNGQRKTCVG